MMREAMVVRQIEARGVRNPDVLAAMRAMPRHRLVPAELREHAYQDSPLPIGHGQTISQPYIVALMTELAEVRSGDRVLEVGTGSGYQAAVLAEMGAVVFTIEIVEPLAERARRDLADLGYTNIQVRAGDGYLGWPEEAPFDAIIVTAGASHVPQPLVDQLKIGGRMVIPVGETLDVLSLRQLTKRDDATLEARDVLPVRFVPLTGPHAERRDRD
ncbi:MAG TPA: protein-L-isoaspartate(D-aspartate) O-methyltransferase [Kiritimatiellia bacterium]|nr:protein-L-isoaspartate(D-aspartate) O-methyltransferase [Kiritimatiellia bacterium]